MALRMSLIGVILYAASASGCKPAIPINHSIDDGQFDRALAGLDRGVEAVSRAIGKIAQESGAWREALDQLERNLKADTQDVLKEFKADTQEILTNEVRNIAETIPHDAGDQAKGTMDYVEVKLKDNLKALRVALENARKEVLEAKGRKDQSGIKRALDKLVAVKVFHDPVVTGFIPAHVQVNWDDHTQASYKLRPPFKDIPLIQVRGWGFERPEGEGSRFALEVVDKDGKKLRDLPPTAIVFTTRYLIQIKMDTPGVEFDKQDHALMFVLGKSPADRLSLPIVHVVPSPPKAEVIPPTKGPDPPPTPTIDRVAIKVKTTNNNKEKNGHVTFYLLGADKQVLLKNGPLGAEDEWKEHSERNVELITPAASPILATPGRSFILRVKVETFRREGLVLDAVKWNTDWEVTLQQRKGKEYRDLHVFPLGQHNFHADLIQDRDFSIVIPPK